MAKTDAENCNTYPRVQIDSGKFALVFVLHGADIRRATCLCLDCTKNMDKNWNINISLIIHVNFDQAREEHYAVKPCTFSYKFNHGLKNVMNMNVH